MITDETLDELARLSALCDPGPWSAVVEGRDAESGDSFIQTGSDAQRGEDIYVTRDSGPADAAYLDLLAAARTHLPLLVAELRALRAEHDGRPVAECAATRSEADGSAVALPPPARPRLLLPDDFADYGWEVEFKGWFPVAVSWRDREVAVTFYDPARLAQDIEAGLASDEQVPVVRVIVVERVTVEHMERAVSRLDRSFFELP